MARKPVLPSDNVAGKSNTDQVDSPGDCEDRKHPRADPECSPGEDATEDHELVALIRTFLNTIKPVPVCVSLEHAT